MDAHDRSVLDEQMARLADGDRGPISRVLATLWPVVRRFTGKMLRVDHDADDAAQRVMIAVFSRAHQYEAGRDALTWVLGIATWECRTTWRRHARRRDDEPLSAVADSARDEATPEEQLVEHEMIVALEDAIGTLSAEDRAALGVGDGESDVAPATVRKRRQRALGRLRRVWSRIHGTR